MSTLSKRIITKDLLRCIRRRLCYAPDCQVRKEETLAGEGAMTPPTPVRVDALQLLMTF